jgi:hypothetical protein
MAVKTHVKGKVASKASPMKKKLPPQNAPQQIPQPPMANAPQGGPAVPGSTPMMAKGGKIKKMAYGGKTKTAQAKRLFSQNNAKKK